MKILLINDYATTDGGANLMTLRLRDELRRQGHEVRLFASSARMVAGLADYVCFGTTSRLRVLLETFNPSAFQCLRKALADFRPDVVHVRMFLTQMSPVILPLLKNIPSIYHPAIYESVCPMGTKLRPDRTFCRARAGAVCYRGGCLPMRGWLPLMLQHKLWRRWNGAFNLIVTNSLAIKRELIAEGVEASATVWNGVPYGEARPPLCGPPTVVFAGRLVPLKGVDVLLRAFAAVVRQIPEAQLMIAGDGVERGNLERLAFDLKLSSHVRMFGQLASAELERHFEVGWVQAVPSFSEMFASTAVEAAMRGTAVVASSVGGLPEIVREGRTGFLVPPGDVDALSERLLKLLTDRKLAEELGRAARARALEHFDLITCAANFARLYDTLCADRAGSDRQSEMNLTFG